MKNFLVQKIGFFLVTVAFFYQLSYSQIQISEKSPKNQRDQSFIFPKNFTNLKTPLYQRLVFVIVDGITYDYVDNRIKEIPYVKEDCDIHIHQIKIFNEILNENKDNVVFQRTQIEPPPKTEIKISTYLRGSNPILFSMKVPIQNAHQINMQDSVFYQIGQADHIQKTYGFLTYYLYDYIGYHLKMNQFSLNPKSNQYSEIKQSEDKKIQEYLEIIKSQDYEALFIYQGLFDEVAHIEGMHSQNGLDAQNRTDYVIREIVKNLDEDAIMLVVSDHGKQESGSHFSCKDENIKVCNSVFFAYSKKGFIKNDKFIESLRRKETDERISRQAEQFQTHESMIASTISNILNIPIPFLNSGRSLLEIYPQSKFGNRIEMLQRILQDSFTTLEQQVEFYQNIQKKKNFYSKDQFENILNQVLEIEDQFYYEQRDKIIYSEEKLEEVIAKIINVQNQIQESIYNDTHLQNKQFLFYGIVASISICLIIIYQSFKEIVQKHEQLKVFLFIFSMVTYGCIVYFMNSPDNLEMYGCSISFCLLIFQGLKVYKNKIKMASLISFLVLNILIYSRNLLFNLKYINILCEIIIFLIYSQGVSVQLKIFKDTQRRVFYFHFTSMVFLALQMCFLINEQTQFCLAFELLFYSYSKIIQKLQMSQQLFKEFKIELALLLIVYRIIGLYCQSPIIIEGLYYQPILLLNLYLLCYASSLNQFIYSSYFTQSHIFFISAVFYQILGLEATNYNQNYSLQLIALFFLPLPLIGTIFSDKRDYLMIVSNAKEPSILITNQGSENNDEQNLVKEKVDQDFFKIFYNKNGIFFISAICLTVSFIGQLWLISNKQVFLYDHFIFNNEYIMVIAVCFSAVNIFISN